MSPVLTPDALETPPVVDGGGNDIHDSGPPGGGGDWGRGGRQPRRRDPYQIVFWVIAVPVAVFFAGLTASMLARRISSDNWVRVQVPDLALWNTVVLLCSSGCLEAALLAMRRAAGPPVRRWLWTTTVLGTVFLAGQVATWKTLAARGIFVATNAASAFFYLLTASHGAHLLAVLAALVYLSIRASRNEFTPRRQSALRAAALFWHFMDGLWLYVLAVLAWA
jgi:cytochrome c oxidase subunit 3